MSTIEANINIDLSDGVNPQEILRAIEHIITSLNGKETAINVVEVDDPLSLSPINMKKIKE